ncbi:MAG: HEAT repeat domain-containing protein, partial [Myxococcales bacterium]
MAACGSKERDAALRSLASPSAKQRAEGARELAKLRASDDASWSALLKSARDGAAPVRAETAAAMSAARRDDAPDAIAPLLRDPDDSVRIAATRALATRCGDRTPAYLRLAFGHSDGAVRAELIDALQKCGVEPEDELAHEEAERRRKAVESSVNPLPAVRARGARELGLLGRDGDKKRLLTMLEDRDGVVVASAARALGDAGAIEAAPRIQALLEEKGEIGAAAAEALRALGPAAVEPARSQLKRLAVLDSDEAVPAAAALGQSCPEALAAPNPRAAALLSVDCPAAPFAKALGAAKNRDALLESLLRAQGDAPGLDAALSKLLKSGDTDTRVPRIAQRYRLAGPALVDALRREQAARAKELAAKRTASEDEGSAAEIARTPAGLAPDRVRYA